MLFTNNEKIAMLTSKGIFKIIDSSIINPIGRVAQGVLALNWIKEDYLVDAQIVESDSTEIISVTKEGLSISCTSLAILKLSGARLKEKYFKKVILLVLY